MKAYSLDLRHRVAAACQEPQAKIAQVAARFCVSISFVDKLLHRQRTTDSLAALPRKGGQSAVLDEAGLAHLRACLIHLPNGTLTELRIYLAATGGPSVGQTALWQGIQWLGWRRKKACTPVNATPSASCCCEPPFWKPWRAKT